MTTTVSSSFFFFFNDTATTEIYTLSLHDALPICSASSSAGLPRRLSGCGRRITSLPSRSHWPQPESLLGDRKSTRLNSSHGYISYAVFCLKKKFISFNGNHAQCGEYISISVR